MPDIKQCPRSAAHEPHPWTEEIKREEEPGQIRDRFRTLFHHCDGRERDLVPEGTTNSLGQVRYQDLQVVKLQFETREGVPTEITFGDLQKGDAVAHITVVEGDDKWAFVDIKFLARKPYKVKEVDDGR